MAAGTDEAFAFRLLQPPAWGRPEAGAGEAGGAAAGEIPDGDLAAVRGIFSAWYAELAEHGVELGSFQNIDAELAAVPGAYGEGKGGFLILACAPGGEVAGAVALRRITHLVTGEPLYEVKRMFVHRPYRGRGLGRALALRVLDESKRRGVGVVWLDSLERLVPALKLYACLGFERCEQYVENPMPDAVYMRLALDAHEADPGRALSET